MPRRDTARHADPREKFFVRVDGHWRVRLAALADTGRINSPAALRELLEAGDLKAFGAEAGPAAIPDDLLVSAAVSGATSNMALLDILDGVCFTRAPCLCCYAARAPPAAREAAAALQRFCQYFDSDSYIRSRAYARDVAAMSRDLRPSEVAEVKDHLARLDTTSDAIREINSGDGGLCVTTPACQPGVLWVYSTTEGRQLLRHLARKGGTPIKVTVASSDPDVSPRFRYRMYAASPAASPAAARSVGVSAMVDAALAWVRGRRT
jgi:hypothetical protein